MVLQSQKVVLLRMTFMIGGGVGKLVPDPTSNLHQVTPALYALDDSQPYCSHVVWVRFWTSGSSIHPYHNGVLACWYE